MHKPFTAVSQCPNKEVICEAAILSNLYVEAVQMLTAME
jgi:hypothetical protein